MEYVHFLVGLEEHSLRQRFFQVTEDYREQTRTYQEEVAPQFQQINLRNRDR